MSDRSFVDTDVLVYAHDVEAGERHDVAADLVTALWESRSVVRTCAAWPTETVGPTEIERASELEERYQMSFWGALIVATAVKAGATRILTEDMSTGRVIEGVVIENPFPRIG
jgi:predicted nucleic acid-binding protein